MNQSEKSRKLSKYEFYQILQLEWIVADLRSRIYVADSDKEYWERVKESKRVKIEDIADSNKLPTIFSDQEMLIEYQRKIYKSKSYPNFIYKNDKDRQTQEPLDLINYYSINVDVRYEIDGETKVGRVKNYLPYAPIIVVADHESANEYRKLSVSEVTRIL